AKDIILYLKTIFANLNRRIEAYTIYYKLKIKPKDSFTNFLIDSPKKLSLLPKTISVIYIRNSYTYFRLSTPYIKREYTPSLSTSERETLIREGRYFNYKEYRYITYNCPKKKPTLAIAITTPTINPPYIDEIVELKANTDSGKRFGLRVERLGYKYPEDTILFLGEYSLPNTISFSITDDTG
ncbi:hypothetical protein N7534_002579, partial [Penicillium rubens]